MRDRLKEFISFNGRYFPLLVIFIVLLLLTGRYLLYGVPHEFLTGEYKGTFEGDYDFTLELVRSFRDWKSFPLWSDTYSGPIGVFASNFHVFEQALLYPFTHNLAVSIKILQASQFFIAGIGMYFLSLHLFKDRVAAVFSAVLYMFTPFYIGHLLSYLHYTGVYLLAPLVYLFILRTIQERSYRFGMALSLTIAYSLLSHPQNIFIGGLFYILFFIAVFIHEAFVSISEGEFRTYLKSIIPISAVIIIATFLLAAFITVPTLLYNYPYLRTSWVKGAGELVKVDYGHIGSHSQSILASVSLQHWPWFQTPLKGGEYPAWYYMGAYLIPFAFASVSLMIRFDWLTAVFVFMTVLSFQIALGIKGSPDLFTFFSKHIPFFGMSRTPYSYINSAILVFCLFSSVTFKWINEKIRDAGLLKNGGGKAGWLLFAFIAVPYLISARYYGNDYNWTFISAKQPEYLGQVWSFLDKNNKDKGRVIETCGIPTAMLLGSRMLPNEVDLLERYHKKEYLGEYLSLFGFKYVITPALHSQRDKTFDTKGYMVPSVTDKTESVEEYYSALTTEYYYMYERLRNDKEFNLNTVGKDVAIFENRKAFADYEVYPARMVLTLGGTDSYDMLGLKTFKKGLKPAPVFLAQSGNLKRFSEISSASRDLVLHNTDALDLFMLFKKDRLNFFQPRPANPKDWDLTVFSFGIQQPFPQQDHSIGNSLFGEMTYADFALTSKAKGASLTGYFDAKRNGNYKVLARIYGSRDSSDLSYSIDGKQKKNIGTSVFSGYRWVELWDGDLAQGPHSITITVEEDKPVYIDSVAAGNSAEMDMGPVTAFDNFKESGISFIANYRKFHLSGDTAFTKMNTGPAGQYKPSIRLAKFDGIQGAGSVNVFIDDKKAGEVPYNELKDETAEFSFPAVDLSPGEHSISIKGIKKGVMFDLIALEAPGGRSMNKPDNFRYERTGPSSYAFDVPEKPAFFFFNETDYPGWKMTASGKVIRPVITNMFMNGFIVPGGKKGEKAEIYYSNTVQRLSVWASLIALAGILAFLFMVLKKKR